MPKRNPPNDLTRERLLGLFRDAGRPLAAGDIYNILQLPREGKKLAKQLLGDLVAEGSIVKLRNKRYGLPREMNLVAGTLSCTRSGNAFVVPDNPKEKDFFVPAELLSDGMHGDKVVARLEHTRRGSKEGKIIKVLHRKARNVVGFVQKARSQWFLVPEDEKVHYRFLIQTTAAKRDFQDGDFAAARIMKFPKGGVAPECRILKVFKGIDDLRSVTEFIEYKYGLPFRFPKKVEQTAGYAEKDRNPEERRDLTGIPHVTIDGELAKDFDDAVAIQKGRNNFTLFVSIADVAAYVVQGSDLDREAYQRGTSVYFPNKVIPMLPKTLSNDLCSLNPLEEKLTMTAELTFTKRGELQKALFYPSRIRSCMRLTYNGVEQALIYRQRETQKELEPVMKDLEIMQELAAILKGRREARGALDFDLPEPDIIHDIEGGITNVVRSERLFAHSLIEEFMIAANEAVAGFFEKGKVPAIYRVHEEPEPEKLRDFNHLLQALSLGGKGGAGPKGPKLQAILREASETEYEFLVNRALLRSLKQARYSAVNKGHFGLASDCYTHFTSPIRRYPDLVCHRILRRMLAPGTEPYGLEQLEQMALQLSEKERDAMEAERELVDRIRVLFMKDKIGEAFEGIISHVTSFGIFVELLEFFVEGVVLVTEMYDDYYLFQEDKFRLMGRRTKKVYRVGDKVKVRLVSADMEKSRLHFAFVP
jgi:ribonuclease R